MNQARALGEWWYTVLRTPIHKIYASDLKRAHSTAVQLVAPRTLLPESDPLSCPGIHITPLVREQHFGIAEGKLWSAGPVSKKQQRRPSASTSTSASASVSVSALDDGQELVEPEVYESIRNRHDKFIGGESLDDLALRAEDAVDRFVWPHLDDAIAHHHRHHHHHHHHTSSSSNSDAEAEAEGGPRENGEAVAEVEGEVGLGYHVVIVSHGLCISEMVAAILRRSANTGASAGIRLKGLVNTGWTRAHIRPLVSDPLVISFFMQCN